MSKRGKEDRKRNEQRKERIIKKIQSTRTNGKRRPELNTVVKNDPRREILVGAQPRTEGSGRGTITLHDHGGKE